MTIPADSKVSGSGLADISAHEMVQLFKNRDATPLQAAEACLERIDLWEEKLNATFRVNGSSVIPHDEIMQAAEAATTRWRNGTPLSKLDGVPITIKASIATLKHPITYGSAATELVPSQVDFPSAARLREAGCVFLAKSTVPDFGMMLSGVSTLHGITRNPWDHSVTPGGSSPGAAAGLAVGYAPLALATDIAGSIRVPSSYCGTFGLKPTFGRVPHVPPYIAKVAGPMTRCARDAALMMDIITSPDVRDYMSLDKTDTDFGATQQSALEGLRFGWTTTTGTSVQTDPEVASAVEQIICWLQARGAKTDEIAPLMNEPWSDALELDFKSRTWSELSLLSPEAFEKVEPQVVGWARESIGATAIDLARAIRLHHQIRANAVMVTSKFDFLITPTSPVLPFPAHLSKPVGAPVGGPGHFTIVFSQSGQPAASIRCGTSKSGVPIGVQVVGPRHSDQAVLGIAMAIEQMILAENGLKAFPMKRASEHG